VIGWRRLLAFAALGLIVGAVYLTRRGTLHRFYLTRCPVEGPEPETEFALHLQPVSTGAFYRALESFEGAVPSAVLARVHDADRPPLPIFLFGPVGTRGGRRLLVVAGLHGNEIAASLAAPHLLADVRDRPGAWAGVELWLVAPANPVGLAHLSRWDARGCDPNRDFGAFETPEATAVRGAFDAARPELVVSLHEGPQDGFFAIATPAVPAGVPEAVAEAAAATGMPLAREDFLGLDLAAPGISREGRAWTLLKRAIRLGSLGLWSEDQGVGTLTTETPWAGDDLEARIRAQVAAVRAAARALAGRDQ
jgi:hypothetical protein